jgi:arylsulfatase A-like enzyme
MGSTICRILCIVLLGALAACATGEPGRRPSILLFVFDTTRADAVSAYGHVAGTTPTFDALASTGVLYTHGYAQAPWTLPSHVSLFTGLLPSIHGVGWRNVRASDDLMTLRGSKTRPTQPTMDR